MIDFLYCTRMPFTVIATKADKLPKTRVKEGVRRVAAAFRTGEGNVIAVSNQTRRGKEEVLAVFDGICARFAERDQSEPADEEETQDLPALP